MQWLLSGVRQSARLEMGAIDGKSRRAGRWIVVRIASTVVYWRFALMRNVVLGLLVAVTVAYSASAETIRFATLNVFWLYDDAAPHKKWAEKRANQSWEQALRLVAVALGEIDADVIALQEVEDRSAVESLNATLSNLGNGYPYFWVGAGTDPYTGQDVAIMSRFPPLTEPILSYPSVREVFNNSRGYPRLAAVQKLMRVDLEISAEPVTVYALHLKSKLGRPFDSNAERFAQARIVRRLARATLEKPKANVIVMGDFNDVSGSDTLRELLGLNDASWNLRNVADSGEMRGESWTYTHEGENQHIDHILVSKFLFDRIVRATVIRFGDEVTDHDAFVVDIDFQKDAK